MKRKRFLTGLLALCFAASAVPAGAFSASAEIELTPALHAAPRSNAGSIMQVRSDLDLEFAKVGELPAAYDMRKEGLVPGIRNQGWHGTCWAHAALGCLEIEEIQRDPYVNYSEWYTAHYAYQGATAYNHSTKEGSDILDEGGRISQSIGMFTNWIGPTNEKDYPYDGEIPDPNKTVAEMRAESQLHVTGYHYFVPWFDNDADKLRAVLKQALADGHGIYFDMQEWLKTSALNNETNAYYAPENIYDLLPEDERTPGAHAMMIVGWDDNYPVENFTFRPEHKGAWLIRNSWGINEHDDGYFWLSYDCPHINNILYFETAEAESRDTLLAYDDFGGNGGFSWNDYGDTSICAANVFTTDENTYLTEVMVNCCNEGDTCEITVYTDLADPVDPISGMATDTVTVTLDRLGYQTIPLAKPVLAEAGKPFAVTVKFSGDLGYHLPLEIGYNEYGTDYPYEENYSILPSSYLAFSKEMILRDFNPGESFFSIDGKTWYDCYTANGNPNNFTVTGNVCVKAVGVKEGKVLFSDYHDTLPYGAQITLSSTDGNPVYYSLNGGEYAEYTQPIEYLGGEITVSAYSQEGIVSTQSYSQQQAALTSLLFHQGWSICKPDITSGDKIKAAISLYDDYPLNLTAIGRGHITVNGENVGSGEKYPLHFDDDTENHITVSVEQENLLPRTYDITLVNIDKQPIPDGVWIGTKGYPILDDGIPDEERQAYDYRYVPYIFEIKDGKGMFRNLTTGETETFTYSKKEDCICEMVFGDKTMVFYQYLTLDNYNNISSFVGTELMLNSYTETDEDFFNGNFELGQYRCISEGGLDSVTVYTDSEIRNAMTNYYTDRTGTTPDRIDIETEPYTVGRITVLLYRGDEFLDSYQADRFGFGYRWNGEQFSYADFLTEPQPVVTTTEATTTTTAATTTTLTTSGTTGSSVSGSTTTVTTAVTTDSSTTAASTTGTEPVSTEYFAPVSKLCEMAQIDYYKKNGTLPAAAESQATADGSLEITLTDKDGKTIDTYTIDPVTGIGTAADGSEVNLPQTGNNAPQTAAAAAGAVLFLCAGIFLTVKSGILRKKEKNTF